MSCHTLYLPSALQVAQRLEIVLKEEFDPDAVTTVLNSLALFGYEASETLIEAIRAALTASYFTCCDPEQLAHLVSYCTSCVIMPALLPSPAGLGL